MATTGKSCLSFVMPHDWTPVQPMTAHVVSRAPTDVSVETLASSLYIVYVMFEC